MAHSRREMIDIVRTVVLERLDNPSTHKVIYSTLWRRRHSVINLGPLRRQLFGLNLSPKIVQRLSLFLLCVINAYCLLSYLIIILILNWAHRPYRVPVDRSLKESLVIFYKIIISLVFVSWLRSNHLTWRSFRYLIYILYWNYNVVI
jgi:hypothetical protein